MESPRKSSPIPGSPLMSTIGENVIEGYMLKKGSRKKWHERYFVFTSDNVLKYYKKKGDLKTKATFCLSRLCDCEVSELFVEKKSKEMIYCVRVSWSTETDSPSGTFDDTSSIGEVSATRAGGLTDDELPAVNDNHRGARSPLRGDKAKVKLDKDEFTLTPKGKPRGVLKKPAVINRAQSDAISHSPSHKKSRSMFSGRSIGGAESLILTPGLRRRKPIDMDSSESHRLVEIPHLVELDQKPAIPKPTHQRAVTSSESITAATLPPVANRQRAQTYEEGKREELEYLRAQYETTQRENKKKSKQKIMQGTKLAAAAGATVGVGVLTAGVGLVAGMVALGVGVTAGGGTAALGSTWKSKNTREITIACRDYETAKQWKSCLDASLESNDVQKSTWGQLFATDPRRARAALVPKKEETNRSVSFETNARWIPLEGGITQYLGTGVQGLRIYCEEKLDDVQQDSVKRRRRFFTKLSVDGKPCPPMKAHVVLSTSPLDAFLCLMSHGQVISTLNPDVLGYGQRVSFEVIEAIDDHTDIIHLVFRPLFLFPSWTLSRDFVLYRYWRLEPDGSYVVCYESVEHLMCPTISDYVRGEMHQVINIAPRKKMSSRRSVKVDPYECLMTSTVQIDPKGWVPTSSIPFFSDQAYGDAFGVDALMQLLDIRDAIDHDRFIPAASDNDFQNRLGQNTCEFRSEFDEIPPELRRNLSNDTGDVSLHEDIDNYDFNFAGHEQSSFMIQTAAGICSNPPQLKSEKWAEPDSNSFRVRGPNYKSDKKKFNAGPSIGRLIAVDVVNVDQPIYTGMSVHPSERIQVALKKEAAMKAKGLKCDMPPFIFVVNIVLPGPPFFHGVFYYAIDDMSTIDGTNGTPSSRLCNEFFFGDDDEFRDRTFKLIPQIVQGNFIVRKAVGSTPAIMGKKLRQLYVKSKRFFEVVLDCGSSPVATGVIRLSLGYAKTLVVDMGFLFEADDEDTLPERIFGCVRIKQLEFGADLRKVKAATPVDPRTC